MSKKYILTDLDGTLLTSEQSLSKYTMQTITRLLNEGHVISFSTARSYISSQRVASEIPWRYPVVLYNGALLFDPVKEQMIDGHFIDSAVANEIIEIGQKHNLSPFLFFLDEHENERVYHVEINRGCEQQFFNDRPNDPRFKQVNQIICEEHHHPMQVTFIGTYDELVPIYYSAEERFKEEIHIHFIPDNYIVNHYFLEFSHRHANKKAGLRKWANHICCNEQEIIVFGDNLNDVGLFERAGTKIAVANAHQTLKDKADQVVASNDDDGVARFLVEYLSKFVQK